MANLIGNFKNNSLAGSDDLDAIFRRPVHHRRSRRGIPGIPDLGVLAAGREAMTPSRWWRQGRPVW